MTRPTRLVWLLSPYHTGSHRAWALGYARHSRHDVRLLTMAGRFWKWRMQGGALELAAIARQRLTAGERPDAILVTDMLNLPAWLGLLRRDLPPDVPVILYMHENQLTYPWRPGEKPDLTYAMINWLSQVAADKIVFNSEYHRGGWFAEAPRLLKHFPDYNHLALVEQARARSMVLPVGVECARLVDDAGYERQPGEPPLILWNQRWEYDKRPDRFFDLLYRLQAEGSAFRLAVAGENFRNEPAEFSIARERLGAKIVHWGYLPAYDEYVELLRRADLVVSTADHEFFGVSILEAVVAGAFPLLPRRLSYPELIPAALHPACLYADEDDLLAKARTRLAAPRRAPPSLRSHVIDHFDWSVVAERYDDLVDELA
jgi:glycosyltransferase involved in cell wall biosynthesis